MSFPANPSYIDEHSLLECKISDKEWLCPVSKSGRILSRKQTLKTHLSSVHDINYEIPVKRYKQYEYDSSIPMPSSTYYSNRKRKIEYDIVNKDEESTIWKQNESISDNDRLASDDQQSLLVDCTSDIMEISSIENSELSSSESSDSESTDVETDQKAKSSEGSCNKNLQMAPLYILQSTRGP